MTLAKAIQQHKGQPVSSTALFRSLEGYVITVY